MNGITGFTVSDSSRIIMATTASSITARLVSNITTGPGGLTIIVPPAFSTTDTSQGISAIIHTGVFRSQGITVFRGTRGLAGGM